MENFNIAPDIATESKGKNNREDWYVSEESTNA